MCDCVDEPGDTVLSERSHTQEEKRCVAWAVCGSWSSRDLAVGEGAGSCGWSSVALRVHCTLVGCSESRSQVLLPHVHEGKLVFALMDLLIGLIEPYHNVHADQSTLKHV